LSEYEWRALGIVMSPGWEHYMLHEPEPHILLFRREKNYQDKYGLTVYGATGYTETQLMNDGGEEDEENNNNDDDEENNEINSENFLKRRKTYIREKNNEEEDEEEDQENHLTHSMFTTLEDCAPTSNAKPNHHSSIKYKTINSNYDDLEQQPDEEEEEETKEEETKEEETEEEKRLEDEDPGSVNNNDDNNDDDAHDMGLEEEDPIPPISSSPPQESHDHQTEIRPKLYQNREEIEGDEKEIDESQHEHEEEENLNVKKRKDIRKPLRVLESTSVSPTPTSDSNLDSNHPSSLNISKSSSITTTTIISTNQIKSHTQPLPSEEIHKSNKERKRRKTSEVTFEELQNILESGTKLVDRVESREIELGSRRSKRIRNSSSK